MTKQNPTPRGLSRWMIASSTILMIILMTIMISNCQNQQDNHENQWLSILWHLGQGHGYNQDDFDNFENNHNNCNNTMKITII